MHILLEGVIQVEVHCLLKYIFSENFVTLNSILNHFDYSNAEKKDKQSVIDAEVLRGLIRAISITDVAVGTIATFNARWFRWSALAVLLDSFEIVDLCLLYSITEKQVCALTELIKQHHHSFTQLYTDIWLTPKFHFVALNP